MSSAAIFVAQPNPTPDAPKRPGATGPRTPEGKSRARLNAYRHGLTGQVLILAPDEQVAFDQLSASMRAHFRPVGPLEEQLVHSIADSQWRLHRISSIENSIFAAALPAPDAATSGIDEVDAAFAQARCWQSEAPNLALLSLYEQRIHRKLQKDQQALQAEQQRRARDFEAAMAVAKPALLAARAQGKPYNPDALFRRTPVTPEFVFSTTEIDRELAADAFRSSPIPLQKEAA